MEDLINATISDSENERLIQIPDNKEILMALNSIPNLKSPGPDGIPSLFYKHYGDTVKPLLISAVKSFFNSGFILKEWNNTFICLVTKCQGASTFKDFRPISLCNVCYKVISKIIANMLKPLLERIISPNQTAFIEGRWINENGLLAQEILHTMRKTKARRGWFGMKIDFTKVFDKLEWSFIIKILERLGFHQIFISWIFQCISTTTFSILLNGSPHGHFSPSRGKQADLHKTIKIIKGNFMERSKKSRATQDRETYHLETSLQLEISKMPTGPDWHIISSDAAWNCNGSCLSGVLHQPHYAPSLSWFQISYEGTPLQAEAKAVLLALTIAADRGFTKIWIRCDTLLLVEAILHPHTLPWEIRNIVSNIISSFNIFS
ncbi:hypothetical protein CRG98_008328 [Punica granatum]|uniref:Reverse transcriptase domain-containing protein n=1 Tax=Punica granatum TaxID=22663 RepID=A0A2I0KS67_PUNGR|nr:hypothetical protein CRG98_008328 [Punica granatum]